MRLAFAWHGSRHLDTPPAGIIRRGQESRESWILRGNLVSVDEDQPTAKRG